MSRAPSRRWRTRAPGAVGRAAELLRGQEDRPEVTAALAQLHDARGELDLAASTLRQALLDHDGNLLLSAPLLNQLVDVEGRRGDSRRPTARR